MTLNPRCAYSYELLLGQATGNHAGLSGLAQRWCDLSANGDQELFRKKLLKENLSKGNINFFESTRNVDQNIVEPNSAWLKLRNELFCSGEVDAKTESIIQTVLNDIERDEKSSFYGFTEKLLKLGLRQLHAKQVSSKDLSGEPMYDLLFSLASRIVWIATPTLTLELNIARMSGELLGESTGERYTFFCQELIVERRWIEQLFDTYPALERQIFEMMTNWVLVIDEFLIRFKSDYSELHSLDNNVGPIESICELSIDLSDHHKNGRTVIICKFEQITIVYKPRSLRIDVVYCDVLKFLNSIEGGKEHRYFWTIEKGSYGWQEFIAHSPCLDSLEVSDYFWRLGSLLALTYSLNGSDFHQGNLIASGSYPVLVDLECLLSTPFAIEDAVNLPAASYIAQSLERSVAWTGLLPDLLDYQADNSFDLSGIGGINDSEWPIPVPTIKLAQQDLMHYELEKQKYGADKNRLMLNEHVIDPSQYVDSILLGYRWTYNAIVEHRNNFHELISKAHDSNVRVLFRGTQYYAMLLDSSRHPDYMSDGLERELFLDAIWKDSPIRKELEQVYIFEKQQLLRNDIPFFTANASSPKILSDDGEETGSTLGMSPLDYCVRKLEFMSFTDMELQGRLIAQSFLQFAKHPARNTKTASTIEYKTDEANKIISDAIKHSASVISEQAVIVNDDIAWLDVRDDGDNLQVRLSPTDESLYSGLSGIALFLAYSKHLVAFDDKFDCIGVSESKMLLQLSDTEHRSNLDWSAFSGLSGTMYSLLHLARLSGRANTNEFISEFRLPDANDLCSRKSVDIISGHAGILLVLLRWFDSTKRKDCLELAVALGNKLAEEAKFSNGTCSWICPEFGVALTGFAHGAGGIAYALSELSRYTRDGRFRDVALHALRFEEGTYDTTRRGWPDLRPHPDKRQTEVSIATDAWCHGRPGILLASKLVDQSRELTVESTDTTEIIRGPIVSDSLCHGLAGNLDILITLNRLASVNQDAIVVPAAANIAQKVLSNDWRSGLLTGVNSPGVMLGLAGIGLALLRSQYSDQVPSILHLEGPSIKMAH